MDKQAGGLDGGIRVGYMDLPTFFGLMERLTGTPVKEPSDREQKFLAEILRDHHRPIDCSQLNELLLLANKDRVEQPFFDCFFGGNSTVGGLAAGIEKFQKLAMLVYGNFIYAYRQLSRLQTDDELNAALGSVCQQPKQLIENFKRRSQKLLDVVVIPREETHLVGYISPSLIIAEHERANLLIGCFGAPEISPEATWDQFIQVVKTACRESEQPAVLRVVKTFRKVNIGASTAEFNHHLSIIQPRLAANVEKLKSVREQALRNQDVYLTWDHMDVYFATSMRKRWEYEDLFVFVNEVMRYHSLADLNLRYFDPTQSFTENRINKGLVESLMLKRAKCTVYSVQDTDTLGKDSELAATLAQGKPVIAYVPDINVEQRTQDLLGETPVAILERLRFVLHADENIQSLNDEENGFVKELQVFQQDQIWQSIIDPNAISTFREHNIAKLSGLCQIIAQSERTIYDKRASTLLNTHPLAVQVNLSSGVANGVLVVRTTEQCAQLIRCLLTNSLEFELEDSTEHKMWYLREKISNSIYRVVSKDRKLTNCFWNFYRQ